MKECCFFVHSALIHMNWLSMLHKNVYTLIEKTVQHLKRCNLGVLYRTGVRVRVRVNSFGNLG